MWWRWWWLSLSNKPVRQTPLPQRDWCCLELWSGRQFSFSRRSLRSFHSSPPPQDLFKWRWLRCQEGNLENSAFNNQNDSDKSKVYYIKGKSQKTTMWISSVTGLYFATPLKTFQKATCKELKRLDPNFRFLLEFALLVAVLIRQLDRMLSWWALAASQSGAPRASGVVDLRSSLRGNPIIWALVHLHLVLRAFLKIYSNLQVKINYNKSSKQILNK